MLIDQCNIEVNAKEGALKHMMIHQENKTGLMKSSSKENKVKENTDYFQPESKEVKMLVDPSAVGKSVGKEIANFKCNFCSYLTTVETNMKKHKEKHQNSSDDPKKKTKKEYFH